MAFSEYEGSLKAYRDIKNSIDSAEEKGKKRGIEKGIKLGIEQGIKQGIEQGIEQGIKQGIEQGMGKGRMQQSEEMAKMMKEAGEPVSKIAKYTGLTIGQINNL